MSSQISTKDTIDPANDPVNPAPLNSPEPASDSIALQKPDNALLADIQFPSTTAIQPNWIRDRYPEYAVDHGMEHELTSVRMAEHNGHQIKITTTYQIEIDGRPTHLHAMVDNDGKLFCHTTPYVEYPSAVDLVKALMDRFPESFTPEDGRLNELHEPTEGEATDHGSHDHPAEPDASNPASPDQHGHDQHNPDQHSHDHSTHEHETRDRGTHDHSTHHH